MEQKSILVYANFIPKKMFYGITMPAQRAIVKPREPALEIYRVSHINPCLRCRVFSVDIFEPASGPGAPRFHGSGIMDDHPGMPNGLLVLRLAQVPRMEK